MERESLRGLWKRCITCVFVQNFGFVSQPTQSEVGQRCSLATDWLRFGNLKIWEPSPYLTYSIMLGVNFSQIFQIR